MHSSTILYSALASEFSRRRSRGRFWRPGRVRWPPSRPRHVERADRVVRLILLEIVAPTPRNRKSADPAGSVWTRWTRHGSSLGPRNVGTSNSASRALPNRTRRRALVARRTWQRHDGIVLRWRCTDPGTVVEEGLIPFLIDCRYTPHPVFTAPRGPGRFIARGSIPDPSRVVCALSALGLALPVARSPHPGPDRDSANRARRNRASLNSRAPALT